MRRFVSRDDFASSECRPARPQHQSAGIWSQPVLPWSSTESCRNPETQLWQQRSGSGSVQGFPQPDGSNGKMRRCYPGRYVAYNANSCQQNMSRHSGNSFREHPYKSRHQRISLPLDSGPYEIISNRNDSQTNRDIRRIRSAFDENNDDRFHGQTGYSTGTFCRANSTHSESEKFINEKSTRTSATGGNTSCRRQFDRYIGNRHSEQIPLYDGCGGQVPSGSGHVNMRFNDSVSSCSRQDGSVHASSSIQNHTASSSRLRETGVNLRIQDLAPCNSGTDHVNSRIQDCTVSHSRLNETDFVNSRIQDRTASNSRLSEASETSLVNSRIQDRTASNSRLSETGHVNSRIQDRTASNSRPSEASETSLVNSRIQDRTASNSRLSETSLVNSRIQDRTASNSRLSEASETSLVNSRIQDRTASNSRLSETSLVNSRIQDRTASNSRLSETGHVNSRIQDCTMSRSRLNEAGLVNSRIHDSTSYNNRLSETDRYNSRTLDTNMCKRLNRETGHAHSMIQDSNSYNRRQSGTVNSRFRDSGFNYCEVSPDEMRCVRRGSRVGTVQHGFGSLEDSRVGTVQHGFGSLEDSRVGTDRHGFGSLEDSRVGTVQHGFGSLEDSRVGTVQHGFGSLEDSRVGTVQHGFGSLEDSRVGTVQHGFGSLEDSRVGTVQHGFGSLEDSRVGTVQHGFGSLEDSRVGTVQHGFGSLEDSRVGTVQHGFGSLEDSRVGTVQHGFSTFEGDLLATPLISSGPGGGNAHGDKQVTQPRDDEQVTQPRDDEQVTQPRDDEQVTQPRDDEQVTQPRDDEETFEDAFGDHGDELMDSVFSDDISLVSEGSRSLASEASPASPGSRSGQIGVLDADLRVSENGKDDATDLEHFVDPETEIRNTSEVTQSDVVVQNASEMGQLKLNGAEVGETADSRLKISDWILKPDPKYRCVRVQGMRHGKLVTSAPIALKDRPNILLTITGSVCHLRGNMDRQLALKNGLPLNIIKKFRSGFPADWQELVEEYFHDSESDKRGDDSKDSTKHGTEKTKLGKCSDGSRSSSLKSRKSQDCKKKSDKTKLRTHGMASEGKGTKINDGVNRQKDKNIDLDMKNSKTKTKNLKRKLESETVKKSKSEAVRSGSCPKQMKKKQRKSNEETHGDQKENHFAVTPWGEMVNVNQMRRTHSGRLSKPPLLWWTGQRVLDQDGEMTIQTPTQYASPFTSPYTEDVKNQYLTHSEAELSVLWTQIREWVLKITSRRQVLKSGNKNKNDRRTDPDKMFKNNLIVGTSTTEVGNRQQAKSDRTDTALDSAVMTATQGSGRKPMKQPVDAVGELPDRCSVTDKGKQTVSSLQKLSPVDMGCTKDVANERLIGVDTQARIHKQTDSSSKDDINAVFIRKNKTRANKGNGKLVYSGKGKFSTSGTQNKNADEQNDIACKQRVICDTRFQNKMDSRQSTKQDSRHSTIGTKQLIEGNDDIVAQKRMITREWRKLQLQDAGTIKKITNAERDLKTKEDSKTRSKIGTKANNENVLQRIVRYDNECRKMSAVRYTRSQEKYRLESLKNTEIFTK